MSTIKFGTDGWRAIIAKDFTVKNVARVSEAVAGWLLQKGTTSKVVVGHDCRFGGALFAETVAKILCDKGIKVMMTRGFVSTPMISMGAVRLQCDLGIIITASHNPPEYNGYKLKGSYGGPLLPQQVAEIEAMIGSEPSIDTDHLSLADFEKHQLLEYVDLETMYCDHVNASFDMEAIRNSSMQFAYDAMYGAGQIAMRRLLPDITFLHCEYNPSFMGQAPEPIHKNLAEFSEMIRLAGNIDCGLVTDGDADRLGLYNSKGEFVDSHHIILLLIHYLCKYKNIKGKVCTAFSTTPRVAKICKHYGLELETVKIGFKYIAEIMIKEDVLLGGEESGGIAIKGHIPERDGIWIGMVLWEFMATSGRSLDELIHEVYDITGPFSFERNDLHIREDIKQRVLANCLEGKYTTFGKYKVARIEDLDGYKYFFENGDWLMIRASGTEPVLRTYAESSTREAAFDILEAAKNTLLS